MSQNSNEEKPNGYELIFITLSCGHNESVTRNDVRRNETYCTGCHHYVKVIK